jgi:hypothetical protein
VTWGLAGAFFWLEGFRLAGKRAARDSVHGTDGYVMRFVQLGMSPIVRAPLIASAGPGEEESRVTTLFEDG